MFMISVNMVHNFCPFLSFSTICVFIFKLNVLWDAYIVGSCLLFNPTIFALIEMSEY